MWKDFLNWLHSVGHEIFDFLTPLAHQIAKAGGPVLVEAAIAAVMAAEANGGTNTDKFDAAHKQVVNTLQEKGIPIVINAINGAIESAVAKMKE